jgi:folate-binding protein YgfZ
MFSQNSTAFHVWQPAAWLRVSGEDALNFLQGQHTNDLRNLMATGAVYGLWLNQKGRVVADSFVVSGSEPGVFWLGSYFSSAAVIRERLEAYIIADDVVIEDQSAGWRGVSVFGAVGRAALGQAVPGSVGFAGRRGAEENSEWIFPATAESEVRTLLAGVPELNAAEMECRRVQAGIPAVPQDIGPGELPNEGGLERAAISYTKGCYLGQEVMARLKSMGKVRRKLQRVAGSGAPPVVPAALWQGGRKVGDLRSVAPTGAGYVGLALLTLMHVQPATGLSLAADAAATITVTETA